MIWGVFSQPRAKLKCDENFSSHLTESNQKSIFLVPITESEVAREIEQLCVNKLGGYDELHPKVVEQSRKTDI